MPVPALGGIGTSSPSSPLSTPVLPSTLAIFAAFVIKVANPAFSISRYSVVSVLQLPSLANNLPIEVLIGSTPSLIWVRLSFIILSASAAIFPLS